jgi:hypothetical protein
MLQILFFKTLKVCTHALSKQVRRCDGTANAMQTAKVTTTKSNRRRRAAVFWSALDAGVGSFAVKSSRSDALLLKTGLLPSLPKPPALARAAPSR